MNGIEDLHLLVRLLEKFLKTDGDLSDKRVEKTLELVRGTLSDSDPDGRKSKEF